MQLILWSKANFFGKINSISTEDSNLCSDALGAHQTQKKRNSICPLRACIKYSKVTSNHERIGILDFTSCPSNE